MDKVATSFKADVKEFATTGLKSYAGKNVETIKTELEVICTCLFECNKLPDDAVDDVISGLAMCSHKNFATIFAQLSTAHKNFILTAVQLKGTLIDQIKQVFDEADTHNTPLHLADK